MNEVERFHSMPGSPVVIHPSKVRYLNGDSYRRVANLWSTVIRQCRREENKIGTQLKKMTAWLANRSSSWVLRFNGNQRKDI